jgi:RNA polymerase sigma-70 factor (ECF subfamily)
VTVKAAKPAHGASTEVPIRNAAPDFDTLVHEHLDFVWRLLRRLGLSESDAEDAAQQVFMIAARKLDELPPETERAFLYGTARRVAANAHRARRRRRDAPAELPELPELESTEGSPFEQLELVRAAALLDELLERLPDDLRRVLVLAELEEVAVPAIAELEQIPVGTAASRLRRARTAFGGLLARAARRNPFGGGDRE